MKYLVVILTVLVLTGLVGGAFYLGTVVSTGPFLTEPVDTKGATPEQQKLIDASPIIREDFLVAKDVKVVRYYDQQFGTLCYRRKRDNEVGQNLGCTTIGGLAVGTGSP
ncbi:hypothetical protein LUCX_228 [Xanthomonas phage vB_XciM_LucasX]|nr:hypothetical protein LUCX_228 [Xanthomonas phage vB_XciM_LucasX]